jgi:hypothetical protein
MKSLTLAIAFIGLTATVSAFAQSSPAPAQQNAAPAMQVAANPTPTTAGTTGTWVAPYGQPVVGKTRAQVYRELVHAEKDGQLAYLNSTVYAH